MTSYKTFLKEIGPQWEDTTEFLCVKCNTTMSEANKGYSFNCHSCWSKNK